MPDAMGRGIAMAILLVVIVLVKVVQAAIIIVIAYLEVSALFDATLLSASVRELPTILITTIRWRRQEQTLRESSQEHWKRGTSCPRDHMGMVKLLGLGQF